MLRWAEPLKGGRALNREFPAAVAVGGDKVYAFGGMEVYYDEIEWTEWKRKLKAQPGHMDVHIFNTVALRWVKLPMLTTETGQRPPEVPAARRFHTAVLIGDTVYVWGGYVFTENNGFCNKLYAFNVDTHRWSRPRVSGTVPESMFIHSACVLNGKVMCVYGAWHMWNEAYQDCDTYIDVYKLDTDTMLWSLIHTGGTAPPISGGHSATVIGTKMFVFGGLPTQGCGLADQLYNLRVFDTETDSWLSGSSSSSAQPHPEGRWGHAAFAYNGELYICDGKGLGLGLDHCLELDDVWKFNPETFRWKKVEPKGRRPSGRNGMGSCMVGERVVLFGGVYINGSQCDDLIILDLSPALKALCKLAVIQYGLERSDLPHDIRWELAAMTDDTPQTTGPIGRDLVHSESTGSS